MKKLGVKYGVEITRPWNSDMYLHNDEVAAVMKANLKAAVYQADDNDDVYTLNELIVLCGGIKMHTGSYTQGEIFEACLKELQTVPNWWLNQEYAYGVRKGLVPAVEKQMVGY